MLRRVRSPATALAAVVIAIAACNTAEPSTDPTAPAESIDTGDATPYAGGVFVAPQGDDSAPGTTEKPVRSLERALEIVPTDGTIVFAGGVHSGGHRIGNIANVTITGLPGAILDGGGAEPFGIFCDGCRELIIEELEIRGFTDVGVGATNSSGITLRKLHVHGNGAAVQFTDWELEGYGIHVDFSSSVTIEGNDVHDNGPDPPILPDRILGTGIDTFGNTDVTIRGNTSHDNHGGGILVEDSFRVVVEGNEVFGNDLDASSDEWWDGGLWLDGGGDVVVRNNVFRDNLGPGIEISDEDYQNPTGYVLIGNISTGNYYGILIWNFGTEDFPPPEVMMLDSNDFAGNDRLDVWIEAEL